MRPKDGNSRPKPWTYVNGLITRWASRTHGPDSSPGRAYRPRPNAESSRNAPQPITHASRARMGEKQPRHPSRHVGRRPAGQRLGHARSYIFTCMPVPRPIVSFHTRQLTRILHGVKPQYPSSRAAPPRAADPWPSEPGHQQPPRTRAAGRLVGAVFGDVNINVTHALVIIRRGNRAIPRPRRFKAILRFTASIKQPVP